MYSLGRGLSIGKLMRMFTLSFGGLAENAAMSVERSRWKAAGLTAGLDKAMRAWLGDGGRDP